MQRWLAVGLLAIVALLGLSLTGNLATLQKLLYVGYGLFVPVMFGLVLLAGAYYGIRHLVTS
jgi:hypothetical protein